MQKRFEQSLEKAALPFCNASKAILRSVQRPSAVSLSGKRVSYHDFQMYRSVYAHHSLLYCQVMQRSAVWSRYVSHLKLSQLNAIKRGRVHSFAHM